ncbi:MAG: lysyl-tRNA synthetase class 2 [Alphaproteobacteria bacterium]|jgi:lysyl-tRNA synthetase class 2
MNDTQSGDRQSPAAGPAAVRQWWRQDALAARRPRLVVRNAVAAALRRWFAEQDFTEVETPALQLSPGLEPQLRAFATRLFEPFEEEGDGVNLYLHTSPEFAMKKLLAGGMERIFQLARVWRNAERSALHHPEFTMLEWYRSGAGWREVAADCEGLVRAAMAATPEELAPERLLARGTARCAVARDWEYLSVAEAFDRHVDIDLLSTISDPENPDRDMLGQAAARAGVRTADSDGWDDIFHRIMLERIEPSLGIGVPTVLHSWPASLAALARIDPDDVRLAERFELYICGVELANGFGELTDADEQRRRFEAEIGRKKSLTGEIYPIDEDFLTALAVMPDAAGIALGFDRLVMLLTDADRIEEVLWAPVG